MPLVAIDGLRVDFGDARRPLAAVEDFALRLDDSEVVGLVGESGSGKSVAMLAVMGLLGPPARVIAERLRFEDADLLMLTPAARRRLLGRKMAMVFQDPIASLDPCFRIGTQIEETLARHEHLGRRERRARAIELLRSVGIPAAESRLAAWPHQLSGGMCQRVMIAIALACRPRLLIADEPTTALDVTVQAQIMDLLLDLQRRTGMALLLVSHDLALIAETTQRTSVMYAGRIVEERPTAALIAAPRHPYTRALLDALPERHRRGERLAAIAGSVPAPGARPSGCAFHPRCPRARPRCVDELPALLPDGDGAVRCHFPLDPAGPDR